MNVAAVRPFREPIEGRLSIVVLRADDFGAEIELRVDGLPAAQDARPRIEGVLRGPECLRATTLPVTAAIVPAAGAGGPHAAVGRIVLTEPSYWSPELPSLYRLEARIGEGRAGAAAERSFGGLIGLRRLVPRGSSFRLEGRRHVLRVLPVAGPPDLERIREVNASIVGMARELALDEPCVLLDADRRGCFVVVRFTGDEDESLVRGISRHPSAAFWIAHDDSAARRLASHRTPLGPLVGLEVDGRLSPPAPPAGVDFLVVMLAEGSEPHAAWLSSPPSLPLVACRPRDRRDEPRKACDLLQASLAEWAAARAPGPRLWDWAGYMPT